MALTEQQKTVALCVLAEIHDKTPVTQLTTKELILEFADLFLATLPIPDSHATKD